ncbi:hypothetical protein Tco_0214263 [Tanacetum coccineum]
MSMVEAEKDDELRVGRKEKAILRIAGDAVRNNPDAVSRKVGHLALNISVGDSNDTHHFDGSMSRGMKVEIACDSSGQNHKVSEPVGSESSKADDDSIISAVRLKLLSCRFKKSKEAILFARLWEIPMSNLNKSQDDSNDDSEGEEYPPHDFTRISLIGGGFSLEDDDLDCYDGYEPQVKGKLPR